MPLTQDQADQLFLDQRALEMKYTQESRIVNYLQGAVAILMLVFLFKRLLKQ